MAKIPVTLEAGTADGKLAFAENIFNASDTKYKDKFQSEINMLLHGEIQGVAKQGRMFPTLDAVQSKIIEPTEGDWVIVTATTPAKVYVFNDTIWQYSGITYEIGPANTTDQITDISIGTTQNVLNAESIYADDNEADEDPIDNPKVEFCEESSYAYNWKSTDGLASDGKSEGNLKDLYENSITNGIVQFNPEFIRVYLDSNNVVLWGITIEGNIYYGKGIPFQIQDKLNKLKDDYSSKIDDLVNKVDSFSQEFNTKILKADIVVVKEHSLSDKESIEYINITIDDNGVLLAAIDKEGYNILPQIKTENLYINTTKVDNNAILSQTTEQSPEYIKVICDSIGNKLWWIDKEGNVGWSKGIPSHVQILLKDLESDIKTEVNTITDKIEEKISVITKITDNFQFIDHPEFSEIKTDKNKVLIETVTKGGEVQHYTKNIFGNVAINGADFTEITNPEYIKIITDRRGVILDAFYTDGTRYIAKLESPTIKALQQAVNKTNEELAQIKSIIPSIPSLAKQEDVDNIKYNLTAAYLNKDCWEPHRVVYVDGTGSESGSYKTITEACEYIESQGSAVDKQWAICVQPGVYNEVFIQVPKFTHIYGGGRGIVKITSYNYKDNEEVIYNPAYGSNNRKCELPVIDTYKGFCKISNLTIESWTGYCVHYDNYYLNTVVMKDVSFILQSYNGPVHSVSSAITGGGAGGTGHYFYWDGCSYERRGTNTQGEHACHTSNYCTYLNVDNIIKNSTFKNAKISLGNIGSYGRAICTIENCTFEPYKESLNSWDSSTRTIMTQNCIISPTMEWDIVGGGNKNFSPNCIYVGSQGGKRLVVQVKTTTIKELSVSGDDAWLFFNNPIYRKSGIELKAKAIGTARVEDIKVGYPDAVDKIQLWFRLGDCRTTNKSFTITSGQITETVVFNRLYTEVDTEDIILQEINSQLTNFEILAEYPKDCFIKLNTSEKTILINTDSVDITRFNLVTLEGKLATTKEEAYGIVLEDTAPQDTMQVWTGNSLYLGLEDGTYTLTNGVLVATSENSDYTIKNGILLFN